MKLKTNNFEEFANFLKNSWRIYIAQECGFRDNLSTTPRDLKAFKGAIFNSGNYFYGKLLPEGEERGK